MSRKKLSSSPSPIAAALHRSSVTTSARPASISGLVSDDCTGSGDDTSYSRNPGVIARIL
ncbi:hypothetical protein ACQEVF_52905 [Nonomuraea polychroma]|uniref:hypothetical protein n=1 Tax=Nonomuraea polychroma TaxID=46176 RepID=UPI003D9283A6